MCYCPAPSFPCAKEEWLAQKGVTDLADTFAVLAADLDAVHLRSVRVMLLVNARTPSTRGSDVSEQNDILMSIDSKEEN